ncbi:EIN3-binding F-box protein 1 [Prunus yedoensis var. nudiflora]|uniref:EIN3-binding F-box protein 1 n=1 Tax=Prunus yedoensis var. nudiflora TaxID=2094558 RepID=A0A315AIS4_PRUYE|nr:EIN3-binding F-box protein 1 [Prunus yedoensis var. nudiflora]
MPALVNYSGDDDFYPAGSFYSNPMDLGCLLSIGSGVYYPPSKRARNDSQFAFEGSDFEQVRKPSIEVLPDECLFEIFRRLDGDKVIQPLKLDNSDDTEMTTGEEDQELENDGYLTRCLEGKKATDIRLAALAVGTSSRGGLGLIEIAKGCPLLEKLDLCQCPSISNRGLIAIAERCPNLTALNVEACSRIGNEGLQAIGRFCSKLQSISIRDCTLVGDHGVSSLLSSASSVLMKVKLQALNITDFSLAVIGHYGKAVTNLFLSGLQNVSEKGFWVMGNAQALQNLVSLTITSCRGTTDVSLEAIGKGCTNLKQMCLRKCCFVSDNGLVGFAKAAGSLESLQLEECNRITQAGIISALSNCGAKLRSLTLVKCMGIKDIGSAVPMLSCCISLQSLSVRNCPGFGSASLALVGRLCPQLQNVDLSGLYGMTDAGILSLLESLEEGLVKVNLNGCLNLTDEVVVALARLHGETLEVLSLDGCRKITDASLAAIADNCLFLRELDVSKCAITDSGLAFLSCADRINLQVLSISGCSEISHKSHSSLKKLGKTLVGLNLQNCTAISNRSVELLVESLWRCDILA